MCVRADDQNAWALARFITSDNPRSEEPQQIITDILAGFKSVNDITVEADRGCAIELLKEIRVMLPDEIKQAKWIKEERERIMFFNSYTNWVSLCFIEKFIKKPFDAFINSIGFQMYHEGILPSISNKYFAEITDVKFTLSNTTKYVSRIQRRKESLPRPLISFYMNIDNLLDDKNLHYFDIANYRFSSFSREVTASFFISII